MREIDDNELYYGEIITLNAFWEACMYYIKRHKENNLEIKRFSLVRDENIKIYKSGGIWYTTNFSNINEHKTCFDACANILHDLSLDLKEEEELLRIFSSSIQKKYSNEEIEKGAKLLKKCII